MKKISLNHKSYFIDDELLILRLSKEHYISETLEKSRYLKHNNRGEGYLKYHQNLYEAFIKPYLKKGLSLDFGCGPTKVYEQLIENTLSYDKYFFNNKIIFEKKFDNLILIEVLEHLKNPEDSIKLLSSLLNKGGRLFISTHFYDVNKLEDWWYLRDETHVCFYNLDSFTRVGQKYHLDLVYTDKEKLIVLEKVI
ncbi:MAG: class I SAM-dependent methyltransferase [Acholeplasmataceae bacterium]|nr:class I SAM-dependent methyltransferase [Acholeplasmataceae bacterium]